jgi:hypothetical protein
MPIKDEQLSNKQHAVPQNIMDVEFKLIGELTMRQFVYIASFAVAAYIAKHVVPNPFKWFFVVGLGLTGLALAFVPFEDRGLDEWIVNFFKAINKPTLRIWKKEIELPTAFAFEQNIQILQQEMITLAPTASRRKLEKYLNQKGKEREKDPLDIPEEEYIQKVAEAFKDLKPTPKQTETVQITQQKDQNEQQKQIKEDEPEEKQEDQQSKQKEKIQKPKHVQKQRDMDKIIQSRIKKSRLKPLDEGKSRGAPPLQPRTSHTGRKFVNLTPTQGKIILPIRGERVISTDVDEEYEEKNKRIQGLLGKKEEAPKSQPRVKKIPSLVEKPNIVSGIVKNRRGNALEDTVIVIRNEKGEPVRALKTDKLGKFFISSPLSEGKYKIKAEKQGYSFDIIPFEVKGGLLPSYEIIGY